jgi:hypothetical protein
MRTSRTKETQWAFAQLLLSCLLLWDMSSCLVVISPTLIQCNLALTFVLLSFLVDCTLMECVAIAGGMFDV